MATAWSLKGQVDLSGATVTGRLSIPKFTWAFTQNSTVGDGVYPQIFRYALAGAATSEYRTKWTSEGGGFGPIPGRTTASSGIAAVIDGNGTYVVDLACLNREGAGIVIGSSWVRGTDVLTFAVPWRIVYSIDDGHIGIWNGSGNYVLVNSGALRGMKYGGQVAVTVQGQQVTITEYPSSIIRQYHRINNSWQPLNPPVANPDYGSTPTLQFTVDSAMSLQPAVLAVQDFGWGVSEGTDTFTKFVRGIRTSLAVGKTAYPQGITSGTVFGQPFIQRAAPNVTLGSILPQTGFGRPTVTRGTTPPWTELPLPGYQQIAQPVNYFVSARRAADIGRGGTAEIAGSTTVTGTLTHDEGVSSGVATVAGGLVADRTVAQVAVTGEATVRVGSITKDASDIPTVAAGEAVVAGALTHDQVAAGHSTGGSVVSGPLVVELELAAGEALGVAESVGHLQLASDVFLIRGEAEVSHPVLELAIPLSVSVAGDSEVVATTVGFGFDVQVVVSLEGEAAATGTLLLAYELLSAMLEGSTSLLQTDSWGEARGSSQVWADAYVEGLLYAYAEGVTLLRQAWLDLFPYGSENPPPPPPEIETLPDQPPITGGGGRPHPKRWPIGAAWNVELAYRALDDPSVLPSWTGDSPGVSKILRYMLGSSGIPFQILSEVRNDAHTSTDAWLAAGDHVYGNALDVVGPDYEVTDTYTVTGRAHGQMARIVSFVKQYPQLFTVALYGRGNSLTIRDGENYDGWTQDELNANSLHIHLASTPEWLREVLHPSLWKRSGGTVNPTVVASSTGVSQAYYSVGEQSSGSSATVQIQTKVVNPSGSVKSADRVEKTGSAGKAKHDRGTVNKANQPPFAPAMITSLPYGSEGTDVSLLGLTRTPLGFPVAKNADGLTGIVVDDGTVYLAQHAARRSAKAYQNGWDKYRFSDMSAHAGVIGAQRLGEYVYGIANAAISGRTQEYGFRMLSNIFVERRYDNTMTYYEIVSGPVGAGNPLKCFPMARNSQLFVDDVYPPSVWYLSGSTVGRFVDDGTPWAWHYRQETPVSPPPGWKAQHQFKFPYWHHYQDYSGPDGALHPTLVHPWAAGDHGAPELWWLVPQSNGRFGVWRSQWGEGNYQEERGWPALVASSNGSDDSVLADADEAYNSEASAFNHTATKIGTVGHFRGFHPGLASPAFRVLRDPKRKNRLWLVLTVTANVYLDSGAGWDGAWYCFSDDDGATWSRPRLAAAMRNRGPFVGTYDGSMQIEITDSGSIVVPVKAAIADEPVVAYTTLNWSMTGNADREGRAVIFKRRGAAWAS